MLICTDLGSGLSDQLFIQSMSGALSRLYGNRLFFDDTFLLQIVGYFGINHLFSFGNQNRIWNTC